MHLDDLRGDSNALAPHYSKFRVSERLLLTGHSHQAWPDIAAAGLMQSFRDAAEHVDGKWGLAWAQSEAMTAALRIRLGDGSGDYAYAQNTHELLLRFLSALPLKERPRIVTTDSEFHSMRRQLKRLEEEGLEVVWVPAEPLESLPERVSKEVDERTSAVMLSLVFFNSGRIARNVGDLVAPCQKMGAELLVDTYHAAGVFDVDIETAGLKDAYLVGGGYKYLQWGEGACFLRFPKECSLRPVCTGWFADFEGLDGPQREGPVVYHDGPSRFAGATYDPASHYRAAAVSAFFDGQGLTPEFLREVNQHQLSLLATEFDALDLPENVVTRDRRVPLSEFSGFLTLTSERAALFQERLKGRGVSTDSRGSKLRLGPAPYLSDRQLRDAMGILGEVVGEMS